MYLLLIALLTFMVTFFGKSDSLDDESDKSCFVHFQRFLFLLLPLNLDFLYLLSSNESDLLDNEYDNDGYGSGSSGTCFFKLNFDNNVGPVSGLGSDIFVPTGVDSKCDVFVDPSKCFGAKIPDFTSKFIN